MPVGNWNLQWLNHNGQRRYPLADDASARDNTDTFQLPNSFIVELDLPVHAGMDTGPAGFFVQSVAVYASGFGVTIGYQPADLSPAVPVAAALIPRQNFNFNSAFVIGGLGDFADTVGKIVIGRLEEIDQQPPGFWEFTHETGRIDPDAIRPMLRGVSSITCVNGEQRSAPLYGDIEFVAGTNIRLTPIVAVGETPRIRIDAISGAGTIDDCVCEGDTALTIPITSINGKPPTADGSFVLVGSDCVTIEQLTNGIRIVDVCSKPCCGCTELERITRDMERLNIQATTVQNYTDRLGVAVDTMSMTVLGSKISDRGCIVCE